MSDQKTWDHPGMDGVFWKAMLSALFENFMQGENDLQLSHNNIITCVSELGINTIGGERCFCQIGGRSVMSHSSHTGKEKQSEILH